MNTTTEKTLKQLARSVKIECRYGAKLDWDKQDKWQQQSTGWSCTLKYQGRRYTFDFWQGSAVTGEPTADGTLDCLLSDAQSGDFDFDEFCGELGYDTDSRKAEQTWQACQKVGVALKRLLGHDYETFLYAQRD